VIDLLVQLTRSEPRYRTPSYAARLLVNCPVMQVVDTWKQGPSDPAGVLCDISDRPSLCSAANWGKNEVVVGSSDHALYVIGEGQERRGHEHVPCLQQLYGHPMHTVVDMYPLY
jgi:hypothetical protein